MSHHDHKHLFLVRHAKSSWQDPYVDDHDRHLNSRGKRNIKKMARNFHWLDIQPECIISSSALRAKETAVPLAHKIDLPTTEISFVEQLYEISPHRLLEFFTSLDNNLQNVMIVAHNPALTIVANELAGYFTANIPTCGIIILRIECNEWRSLPISETSLVYEDYPKKEDSHLWAQN
jgi:phosphohistidine phosphatase